MVNGMSGQRAILGDSIADILAEAGISVGRRPLVPGGNVKLLCPVCGGGSTREMSLSLHLDADGMGAAWQCHRARCEGGRMVPGCGRIRTARPRSAGDMAIKRQPPVVVAPPTIPVEDQKRPGWLYAFLDKRGIGAETVDAFGLFALERRWPLGDGEWGPKPTIVFPYLLAGKVVNRKYRSLDKEFQQEKDALRSLFNIDAVESNDELIFAEGEMDVLALWEAGFRQAVSLPDGAPQKLLPEGDAKRAADRRFQALETCLDKIADVQRIILATDADEPGRALAEEVARRLGKHRCWLVQWPAGCKDANEVLVQHGARVVQECIAGAQPYPLAGLVHIRRMQLVAYRHARLGPRSLRCGIGDLDAVARLPHGGGWLTVLTGIPSHGKSTLLRNLLIRHAMHNDLGVIWCSPEDGTPENLALGLAGLSCGKPIYDGPMGPGMSDEELLDAETQIAKRFTFLASSDHTQEMTLEWVEAKATDALRRHKRNLLVLDPWGEFEHQYRPGETEAHYLARWLRRLKAWGRANACDILIAAHPTKLMRATDGSYPVADGYSISGGAGWSNRADLGLTVFRRAEGVIEIHTWKTRFPEFGQQQAQARLSLLPHTGLLASTSGVDGLGGTRSGPGGNWRRLGGP